MSGPFGSQQWMYNASSGFYPYELDNSLKFEDGDSPYLSRTPASAGNQKTWTFSAWFKRGNVNADCMIFSASSNSSNLLYLQVRKDSNSNVVTVTWRQGSATTRGLTTNAVFRDVSSYYHVVLACDTTQSSASDRLKLYINGSEVTSFSLDNRSTISQNSNLIVNSANLHTIGAYSYSLSAYYDGYLAEVNFIDGTALDASSFGETKEGIWIPKDPTGLTYGTNGFRLPFTETTTANGFNTVTYSGNGATQSIEGVGFKPDFVWIKNRDTTDSHVLFDSVRGVSKRLFSNLTNAESTDSSSLTSFNSDGFSAGGHDGTNKSGSSHVAWCWGGGTNDKTYTVTVVDDSGNKYRFDGHGTSSIALNLTEGATYTFNYPSAHPLRFSTTSDGTHGGGSEYTTGVTYVSSTQVKITVASGAPVLYYYCSSHSGMGGQINTNTTDGPTHAEGTILSRTKPNADYGFSIVQYTGSGANATVAHGLSSAPKLILFKKRDVSTDWMVYNHTVGNNRFLYLNLDNPQTGTDSSYFNDTDPTDSLIHLGTYHRNNTSSERYIAYCFADVTGHQKIGSYSGTGSSGNAITGLGFKPAFLMIKGISNSGSWVVFDNTRSPDTTGVHKALFWHVNNAEVDNSSTYDIEFTSDGFTLDSTAGNHNVSGRDYIYLAIADTRDAAFTSDASGNGNNFDANDLQHSDVMPDTPTDGFSTLNVLNKYSGITLTEGNLTAKGPDNAWRNVDNTIHMSSGKWYWEVYINNVSSHQMQGIVPSVRANGKTNFTADVYAGSYSDEWGYRNDGRLYNSASGTSWGSTYTTGDILGFALDMDAGTLDVTKNGASTGSQITGISGSYRVCCTLYGSASKASYNFGQDSSFNANEIAQGNADDNGKGDFYYAPPSGYLALCNANLPDPAIDPNAGENPENYFNTVFYSGNSGSGNAVTGVGFQPDWTWVKSRNTSGEAHKVVDSVRGAGLTVFPIGTSAEIDYSGGVGFDSFDADGFTVSHSAANNQWNVSGRTYVAWNWLAGTAFSNSSGTNGATIDSTGSVNTEAGFSIVSYTGDNTNNNGRIAHGLSSAPEMIIAKKRNGTSNWWVYHKDLNGGTDPYHYYLLLNSTAGEASRASATNKVWGTANPDANTFGGGLFGPNGSGTRIAYCFHGVEGYSKFGSYKGNGSSTNGPFVYTGFRPAFIIAKDIDGADNWRMYDNKRIGFNASNYVLYPNLQNAEGSVTDHYDFLSNGFKLRSNNNNTSNRNYIYMAFAEQPFKYSNAR